MTRINQVGRTALLALSLPLLTIRPAARAQEGTASPLTARSSTTCEAEKPLHRFPAECHVLLSALPADTETVTLARDFTFRDDESPAPSSPRNGEPEPPVTPRAVFDTVVVPRVVASAQPPRIVHDWLRGRRVSLMVAGGRDYRIASAFGSYVYESAAAFVLSEPLGAAKEEWLRALSAEQTSSRRVAGWDVSVLPVDHSDRESHIEVQEWAGSYVALLDDRTIVTATSDRYLEEFLDRLNAGESPAPARVLSLLREVSPEDDAWLLRIPAANAQTRKLAMRPLFATVLWRWRGGAAPNFTGRYQPAAGRSLAEVRTAVISYFEKGPDAPLSAALRHEATDDAYRLQLDFTGLKPKESEADANLLMNFAFLFLRNHPGFY
jgi:hypothetical protein